jgi:HSP20 family molecular chaperone IbpA
MSAYYTTHHFSPRWSAPSHPHDSSEHPHPPPLTSTTITAPSIAPPRSSAHTTEPSSSHKHFGLDTLTHLLHTFNTHFEDQATHNEAAHPRFDLAENKTVYAIYGELAGLSREDVSVQVNDHLSTITILGQLQRFTPPGTTKAEGTAADDVGVVHRDSTAQSGEGSKTEDVGKPTERIKKEDPDLHWHVTERRVGPFHRAFQFPVETVDMGAVTASMCHGLLCVLVPKRTGERKVEEGRKVEIS